MWLTAPSGQYYTTKWVIILSKSLIWVIIISPTSLPWFKLSSDSQDQLTLIKNEFIHLVKVFFWMWSRSSCRTLMRPCSNLSTSSRCDIVSDDDGGLSLHANRLYLHIYINDKWISVEQCLINRLRQQIRNISKMKPVVNMFSTFLMAC